jgi:hypothetical protein
VLPARSPSLNAYAERWVRSVKEECLSKVILFGEGSLRRALSEYVEHYHAERNHQGKATSCCLLKIQTIVASGRCSAASGGEGSCAITIKRRRDSSTGHLILGRNDPCPCGSGKKFKRCHGAPDIALH